MERGAAACLALRASRAGSSAPGRDDDRVHDLLRRSQIAGRRAGEAGDLEDGRYTFDIDDPHLDRFRWTLHAVPGAAGLGHDDEQVLAAIGARVGRRLDVDTRSGVAAERRVDLVRGDEVLARLPGRAG